MANNAKHPQFNLLLTRPKAGSDAFWSALGADVRAALTPIISPLISIVPLTPQLRPFHAAIFTSANGVQNSPQGDQRTAYCVGAMTTKAALAAGWNAVQKGETADELVQGLLDADIVGPLVHFSGVHTRGDIAERLSSKGLKIGRIPVYDQKFMSFSAQAVDATRSSFPLLVPLFSPRTADRFATLYSGTAELHIIALSEDVADHVRDLDYVSKTVLDQPRRLAMVEAVEMHTLHPRLG